MVTKVWDHNIGKILESLNPMIFSIQYLKKTLQEIGMKERLINTKSTLTQQSRWLSHIVNISQRIGVHHTLRQACKKRYNNK